jgi:hypothetical protein
MEPHMNEEARFHDERARALGRSLHLTFGHLDRDTLASCFENVFNKPAEGPLWERFIIAYLAAVTSEESEPAGREAKTSRESSAVAVMTCSFISPGRRLELLDVHWTVV